MSVAKIKNKKHVVKHLQKAVIIKKGKDDDSYYKLYKREKKERKRLQHTVGQIEARIEKVNDENQQIFTDMQVSIDYWRFSFMLSENHGVDFLNFEIGLLQKGLIKKQEENKVDAKTD